MATHEDLQREDDVRPGSERSFGFVFAGFCAIVAGLHLWWRDGAFYAWGIAAVAFAALALAAPKVLRPLNILWFKFGILLHHVITPVILALMFYVVFTPLGLLMRVLGKRPLGLRFERDKGSYWIERTPPGPPPESFPNQF